MAKIVSRTTASPVEERFQEVLVNNSTGAIAYDQSGIIQVAPDLPGLVEQTEALLISLITTLQRAAIDLAVTRLDAAQLEIKVDELESIVENLLGDVSYDDALDHATTDLMECFAASGSAEVTADGELSFDERITFTKADIKPFLREAITRWIEQRLGA